MLDTVKNLCALSGVSGAEDGVREYILARVMDLAESVDTDAMGNLLVFKKGTVSPKQKLMLCAHMDEVGLIVTGITDEGNLRFGCVGGIDRRILPGKRVFVGEKRLPGVIGLKPTHLTEKDEERKSPPPDKLQIDIGCENREEAEALVCLGDRCVFPAGQAILGGGWLKAKAIDDRAGCAVLLRLLEGELACDCTFAFTACEEVGARGAAIASYAAAPEVCLILEGTTATDMPGLEEGKVICHAGEGVVIPFMDRGTVYDRRMGEMLRKLARENGIACQTKRRIAGGTDGQSIQRSRSGVITAALACAVRNIHTPVSSVKISELEDMLTLTKLFMASFAKNGIA